VVAIVAGRAGVGIPSFLRIELDMEADVPGIEEDEFQRLAEAARVGCPVSKALAGTEIALCARLVAAVGDPSAA